MRLNLGSGGQALGDGWTNVDLDGGEVRHDLRVTPWPFADGCASEANKAAFTARVRAAVGVPA
jgi:hypothetical protein